MDCQELFYHDVVAVDFYKKSDCTFPIPFNVPNIQTMVDISLGDSQLHIGMSDADISIDTSATLKISRARQAAGYIYSHEIDCTVAGGAETCDACVAELDGIEFIVVTTDANGEKHLHYSLPGTPAISFERSIGESNDNGSLKVTMSSMSSLITISTAN